MLAGVGGRTIAQAKSAVSMSEAATWAAYRKKRGSFNPSLRLEEGFAHVRASIINLVSKDPVDAAIFMPHVIPPERLAEKEKPADINDVFGVLRAVAKSSAGAKKARQEKP